MGACGDEQKECGGLALLRLAAHGGPIQDLHFFHFHDSILTEIRERSIRSGTLTAQILGISLTVAEGGTSAAEVSLRQDSGKCVSARAVFIAGMALHKWQMHGEWDGESFFSTWNPQRRAYEITCDSLLTDRLRSSDNAPADLLTGPKRFVHPVLTWGLDNQGMPSDRLTNESAPLGFKGKNRRGHQPFAMSRKMAFECQGRPDKAVGNRGPCST
jgi:hypothetical protein